MTRASDKAREERWKRAGHTRLTARITAKADEVLNHMARQYRCTRRDVIEGLLLGTIKHELLPAPVLNAMRMHGLSEQEARYVVEQGIAA